MKKYQAIKWTLLGFVFAASVNVLVQCSKDDDPLFDSVDEELTKIEIDIEGIEEVGEEIEGLFLDSDMDGLILMKFEDANSEEQNVEYAEEDLETIGKAFKKRKINFVGERVVEYSYKVDGEEYTMAIGLDSDEEWKILRF